MFLTALGMAAIFGAIALKINLHYLDKEIRKAEEERY